MFILTDRGILEVKYKSSIGKLFCKHKYIEGEICSSNGMTRISGIDKLIICEKCGKVKNEYSYDY